MTTIDTETTRTYSGVDNNRKHRTWGAAHTQLLREDVGHGYEDGIGNHLARESGPSTRYVSNKVCKLNKLKPHKKLSSFMWGWGQYLDHEIDLSGEGGAIAPISVPQNDTQLGGGSSIHFSRSDHDYSASRGCVPRQQINIISAYIDASNVYGSDENRADALRTKSGGKLKTSGKNLLPLNLGQLPNANKRENKDLFLAGDIRSNEVSILTSMHTLFVREHNRRCGQISKQNPGLSDEKIYQRARRYVGALEQIITYEEFLPALLGKNALSPYQGYDEQVNAGVSNLFSAACYRLGHSMVSETVKVENKLKSLTIRQIFFNPDWVKKYGIEPFLAGLAKQKMKNVDTQIVDSLRSFLFQDKNGIGLDLAALNMQRGRDHGLPDYNTCRERLSLGRKKSFKDISKSKAIASSLEEAYGGNIDAIDPWIGGLAEGHVFGATVGEFFFTVMKDQFERFRDGDRFWYENDPVLVKELAELGEDPKWLKSRTLSDVIKDNTNLKPQPKVFYVLK